MIAWSHNVTWEIRNILFPLSQDLLPANLAEWWVRVAAFSPGHLGSFDKSKIWDFPFQKAYGHQTFKGRSLGEELSTTKLLQGPAANEKFR